MPGRPGGRLEAQLWHDRLVDQRRSWWRRSKLIRCRTSWTKQTKLSSNSPLHPSESASSYVQDDIAEHCSGNPQAGGRVTYPINQLYSNLPKTYIDLNRGPVCLCRRAGSLTRGPEQAIRSQSVQAQEGQPGATSRECRPG